MKYESKRIRELKAKKKLEQEKLNEDKKIYLLKFSNNDKFAFQMSRAPLDMKMSDIVKSFSYHAMKQCDFTPIFIHAICLRKEDEYLWNENRELVDYRDVWDILWNNVKEDDGSFMIQIENINKVIN